MIPIRGTIPRRNPPIMMWLIILANSLVFLFEFAMPEHMLLQFFYQFGSCRRGTLTLVGPFGSGSLLTITSRF